MAGLGDPGFAHSGAQDESPGVFPQEAALLREKVDGVLASPAFLRAPILSRLLRYLLERTIAGEAETLKAYTIAVEGLARSPDFDPQFDSYPRVQMVRLRKALEAYCADDPSMQDPCVYLCARSYRLQLEARHIAYPHLAPRASATAPAPLGFTALSSDMTGGPTRLWLMIFAGLLAAGLAALVAIVIYSSDTQGTDAAAPDTVHAPIVEIATRERGGGLAASRPDFRRLVRSPDAVLDNTQVRGKPAEPTDLARHSSYRVALSDTNDRVTIQLIDEQTGMIIWTDSVGVDNSADLREALAPLIAKIVGPFGVIARNQAAQIRPTSTGSYACILRYFAFYRTRDLGERDAISSCLAQPVDEPQLVATVNAVRAFYTMEASVWPDREAQFRTAERFARFANEADADDPYARYAKARLAYLRGRCPVGLHYGDMAVAANPYDAVIVTVLSSLTAACAPDKARQFLDRAYRIRNENDIATRASLTLATIVQGQERRLGELGFMNRPPAGPQLPNYLLTESLIAAAQGRRNDAKALWAEFRDLRPRATSDDERLKTVILSDPMRAQVLAMMRARGVTGAGE